MPVVNSSTLGCRPLGQGVQHRSLAFCDTSAPMHIGIPLRIGRHWRSSSAPFFRAVHRKSPRVDRCLGLSHTLPIRCTPCRRTSRSCRSSGIRPVPLPGGVSSVSSVPLICAGMRPDWFTRRPSSASRRRWNNSASRGAPAAASAASGSSPRRTRCRSPIPTDNRSSIAGRIVLEDVLVDRIQVACQAIEQFRPAGLQLPAQQFLRLSVILDPNQAVPLLPVRQPLLVHLPGQPFPPV